MTYQLVSLADLSVNNHNDRHGELPDETAAMAWLLIRHEQHMRYLARDIVAQGKIYEPPLISSVNGKYVVFDGNRRITCLKLLSNPERAPTPETQKFFSSIRSEWQGELPDRIECQIESDRDEIDEILYRRHTGSQSGIGQSPWDDIAKANFVERTGKKTKINVAEEIEKALHERRFLTTAKRVPRSNMNRLLSAEGFRNRLGFTLHDNEIAFTHDPAKVLKALGKVAEDLIDKKLVLGDLWDNESKRRYLDRLDKDGFVPKTEDLLQQRVTFGGEPHKPRDRSRRPSKEKLARRTTLIPDLDYGVTWTGKTARQRESWRELQNELALERQPNATAVLFRVLLELSVEHYVFEKKPSTVHKDDKLANKVVKAAQHMLACKEIEKKYLQDVQKFERSEAIISANTMNNYVHSKTFSPSSQHLIAMWDSLSDFIVHCLSA